MFVALYFLGKFIAGAFMVVAALLAAVLYFAFLVFCGIGALVWMALVALVQHEQKRPVKLL